jgi:SAM-dependent methyltransferase
LNIDIEKIAMARQRNLHGLSKIGQDNNLEYLLSGIRLELIERFRDYASQIDQKFERGLVIDFSESDLYGEIAQTVEHLSFMQDPLSTNKRWAKFEDGSFDCVVVNLQGSWLDFQKHLSDVYRILSPGGVYLFSCFGPDTLYEVWEAWHGLDDFPHVHDFVDMHHLGDALVKTGFEKPIVDADWTFIDYPDLDTLIKDLQAEGFTNMRNDRRKTLTGKSRFSAFKSKLMEKPKIRNPLKITYEVVYGLGVKSDSISPRSENGSIRVNPPTI